MFDCTDNCSQPVSRRRVRLARKEGQRKARIRGRRRRASWSLLFEPNDCMDMAELWAAFHQRWGSYPDLVLLRGLEHSGCIIVDRCTGQMKLSPLYHLAWQLRRLLYSVTEPGEEPKMSLVLLEEAYLRRYGKPPPLQQLGFKSLEELLNSLPKYFDMCWDRDARAVSLAEVNRMPVETVANDLSSVSTVRVPSAANYSTVDQATTSSLESCSEPELLELCRQAEPELMQLHPEPMPCHLPEPELLELFPTTDDSLLDEPIPSNVPSPVICPEVPQAGDLIQFDGADSVARPRSETDCSASPVQTTKKRRIAALFPVLLSQ
ncbi:hypothetical protein MRX96_021778 [Rhipicephalus microplus]